METEWAVEFITRHKFESPHWLNISSERDVPPDCVVGNEPKDTHVKTAALQEMETIRWKSESVQWRKQTEKIYKKKGYNESVNKIRV